MVRLRAPEGMVGGKASHPRTLQAARATGVQNTSLCSCLEAAALATAATWKLR